MYSVITLLREMVVIVNGTLRSVGFVLAETFGTHPDLSVRVGEVVANGDETVMPLCWARNVPADRLLDTLGSDPSVVEVELLSEEDGADLYRMEWRDETRFLVRALTHGRATILDALGTSDGWRFRVLYPDRDALARTVEHGEEHDIPIEIGSIRGVDSDFASRYGLTGDQREAPVTASEHGYFSIPRETPLTELARETGTSHQALSERLRRGTEALVENTLLFETPDERSGNVTSDTAADDADQPA